MNAESTPVFIGAWSYAQVRAFMIADADRIGWHQHGSCWVWGIAPGDGCWLCDTAEAHWSPRLQAAARADRSTGDVDVARRVRLAAARRAGILVEVVPATAASVPVAAAMQVNKPTASQVELPTPPKVPLVLDDELADDAPAPSLNPALPPLPIFVLSHPTAESIRRNRKKR